MKTLVLGAALVGLLVGAAMAQPETQYQSPIPEERTFLVDRDKYEGLTPGEGRETTFYAFQNCFKIGWIKRQRLTRTEWELAVDQMMKDCNQEPLDADEKEQIVEYLATNYGRRR
ncbi:MAG: hypothetical protein AB7O49_20075 [Sphingomonadales bacterium]